MYYSLKAIILSCILILLVSPEAFAQYQGSPVTRDRLVQVLRSKRFPSRDIVQIIKENGVDFKLSPATQNQLVAAGARPDVLDAVRRNFRAAATGRNRVPARGVPEYSALLDDAVDAYDIKKDRELAFGILQRAVALQPGNPRAYQLLGFLSLYGKRDIKAAEGYWKRSISLGGNAVIRVIHDHNGTFTANCDGSLYISRNTVRYESDNNDHTFETNKSNIRKVEVNSRWRRLVQVKGGSFKLLLNENEDETNYNFAPLSGKTDESKMIISLIGK